MASSIKPTTSITDWNYATKRVEANLRSGRYISAETCLLFAGPPRLSDIDSLTSLLTSEAGTSNAESVQGKDALYPIGSAENFTIMQSKAVQKVFEIGSVRSYQGGGRVQVSGQTGRVLFNGPSLLRAMYAYYPNTIALANGKKLAKNTTGGGMVDGVGRGILSANAGENDPASIFPPIFFEAGTIAAKNPEEDYQNAFFINLMSELFSQPFGVGMLMRDNRKQSYGGFLVEDCMINTHSLGISSTSTLVTEAISFTGDAVIPLEFSTDIAPQ